MPLPSLRKHQVYTANLPSGRKLKYRPWIMKEEQDYMYATEGIEDKNIRMDHIEQLLANVIEDGTELDDLSDVDLFAFAVEARMKSRGSTHDIIFTCPTCKKVNDDVLIDLKEDVKIKKFNTDPIIVGQYEFVFRDVSRKKMKEINELPKKKMRTFAYFAASLKSFSDEENTYENFTFEEAKTFFEEMDPIIFKEVEAKWLDSLSSFAVYREEKCQHCGKKTIVFIDDIVDFFV